MSDESQKGITTLQRCSVENQKGAIVMDLVVSRDSVLSGSQWNIIEQC